jgi:acyl phosphate:glycerol-3-phosphate acyltransferase
VATFLGILLALAWPLGLAACATWAVTALVTRTSSIAALMAAGMTPMWLFLLNEGLLLVLTAILTVLVYLRHTENLKRIKAGTEPKIGKRAG